MVILGNSNIQLVAPATWESYHRKDSMKQGSQKVHLNSGTRGTTARRFHHTSLPLKRNWNEDSSSFLLAMSWSRKQGRVEMQATKNICWANRAGRAWESEANIWVPAGSSETHTGWAAVDVRLAGKRNSYQDCGQWCTDGCKTCKFYMIFRRSKRNLAALIYFFRLQWFSKTFTRDSEVSKLVSLSFR